MCALRVIAEVAFDCGAVSLKRNFAAQHFADADCHLEASNRGVYPDVLTLCNVAANRSHPLTQFLVYL